MYRMAIVLPLIGLLSLPAKADERIIETYGYSAREPATGAARGKQVYEQWCVICHGAGPGMAGTESLARKYKGQLPPILTEREDLTPEFVSLFVRDGVKSMPFFRKTEISDADLKTLNMYLMDPKGVE